MADWTESYRPSTLSEVRGNNKARDAFEEWGKTWDDHGEAVILYGSPGVGKTSAAHALAADMGWKTVELNASDQRTADAIERFAGRAARNTTLGGSEEGVSGRQLVIVDEADNIHGNYDRGGAQAVTSLVKGANQPIVLIANEFYEMSRGLRNACQDIEFRDVSARSIVPVLRDICRKEEIEFDADALQRIADANSGDLRGAVKDLQATAEGKEKLTVDDVVMGARDTTVGIFTVLDAILKEKSAQEALYTAYDADETPDDLTAWVEDKVMKVYDPGETVRAYEFLANADRWLGRVLATQNYSYWRYVTDNVAAGVAASHDETRGGWTQYGGRPQMWPSSDATIDEICRKVADAEGTSIETARREILPFLSAAIHHCKPRELAVAVTAYFQFDESALSAVSGSGESTNKVQGIVEDAEKLREDALEAHAGGAFAGVPRETSGDDDGDDPEESPDAGESEPQAAAADDDDGADVDEESTDDSQAGLSDFV
ncbi:MAG: replication factor C large subunit [Halolamina sp.]